MSLKLMYITNDAYVASLAQEVGVDRIFIDMEQLRKEERQFGMNTVKSFHTFSDIENIYKVTNRGSAELLVRINPMHSKTSGFCSSREEIDTSIKCGADILMLPMYKSQKEVDDFLSIVDGRAKTILLLETREAYENIEDIISIGGFDEVHIGLNDLHLAYGCKFMFELFTNGIIDKLANVLNYHNVTYGVGGIARIGYGTLPAEYIIQEHYRIGSRAAILSRSFCNVNDITDKQEIYNTFKKGIYDIRMCEQQCETMTEFDHFISHKNVETIINQIIKEK